MELDDAVKGRRTIRKYLKKDVPPEMVRELVDLARYAPSSMNGQPWFFIIIRDPEIKARLVNVKNKHCPIEKQTYRADFLQDAPVIVVVCVDKEKSYDREVENAVLATAHILLGAHSRGLGGVYMSAYRPGDPVVSNEIRQILDIPENVHPITLIPLGYPAETPSSKEIKSLKEIIYYDVFAKRQSGF